MKTSIIVLCCIALLFAACQNAQPGQPPVPEQRDIAPQQELPQEPEPPAQTEEADPEEVAAIDSGLDKVFGPRDESQVITLDDVQCNRDKREITFRFRNLDTKSWQLNQQVPFPSPKDLVPVRITVNQYEVNGRAQYRDSEGTLLFSQSEKFSGACGDKEVLVPGEEIECTLSPVPLKSSTGLDTGANEIFINSAAVDGRARFTCGQ